MQRILMMLKPAKMRIDPPNKERVLKKDDPKYVEAIAKKVAIAVAFISVFIFFFKLLFF